MVSFPFLILPFQLIYLLLQFDDIQRQFLDLLINVAKISFFFVYASILQKISSTIRCCLPLD